MFLGLGLHFWNTRKERGEKDTAASASSSASVLLWLSGLEAHFMGWVYLYSFHWIPVHSSYICSN